MFLGSIVVLAAALLPAPIAPLAGPAAATSQPVVSSVSPGSGTIGTPIAITGSGFENTCPGGQGDQVFFGGVAATNATFSSDGAATAVAPPHPAGGVYVRVMDCHGALSAVSPADTFVYPAPVVSSVSPGSGTIGTSVYDHRLGFRLRLYRRAGGPGAIRRGSGNGRDRYRWGGHSRRAAAPRGGGAREGGGLPRRSVGGIPLLTRSSIRRPWLARFRRGRGRSAPALRSQARVSITAVPAGSRARCYSAG